MMKAISLWEPWGTAMSLDMKRNETRHWPTAYRGELAICSAKKPLDADSLYVAREVGISIGALRFGFVLCVVDLFDCVKSESIIELVSETEYDLGNYDPNRFAWLTRNVRRLREPVPVKGAQGFFFLPDAVESQVRAQL